MNGLEIKNRINELIRNGKVYEYAGRCWFTCYMAWSKLKKEEKQIVKIIEGEADGFLHYWLEADGQIIDVHYALIDNDLDVEEEYQYKKEKEINPFDLKVDKESYEEKPAVNWLGREKWAKVYSVS